MTTTDTRIETLCRWLSLPLDEIRPATDFDGFLVSSFVIERIVGIINAVIDSRPEIRVEVRR